MTIKCSSENQNTTEDTRKINVILKVDYPEKDTFSSSRTIFYNSGTLATSSNIISFSLKKALDINGNVTIAIPWSIGPQTLEDLELGTDEIEWKILMDPIRRTTDNLVDYLQHYFLFLFGDECFQKEVPDYLESRENDILGCRYIKYMNQKQPKKLTHSRKESLRQMKTYIRENSYRACTEQNFKIFMSMRWIARGAHLVRIMLEATEFENLQFSSITSPVELVGENEFQDVHAEVKVANALRVRGIQKTYIGISKPCCLVCSFVVVQKFEFIVRECSEIFFPWVLPKEDVNGSELEDYLNIHFVVVHQTGDGVEVKVVTKLKDKTTNVL